MGLIGGFTPRDDVTVDHMLICNHQSVLWEQVVTDGPVVSSYLCGSVLLLTRFSLKSP